VIWPIASRSWREVWLAAWCELRNASGFSGRIASAPDSTAIALSTRRAALVKQWAGGAEDSAARARLTALSEACQTLPYQALPRQPNHASLSLQQNYRDQFKHCAAGLRASRLGSPGSCSGWPAGKRIADSESTSLCALQRAARSTTSLSRCGATSQAGLHVATNSRSRANPDPRCMNGTRCARRSRQSPVPASGQRNVPTMPDSHPNRT